ncbi:DUF1203 domain-containing protein [Sphingopyxis sp. MWB1]|uniref:DUF1203 domain-containing protein n=1 Tax=Sphingopyxis sp. MWB1 TaxID=1537715 RepID=UPI000519FDD3|nr:DUF1203 domain-containing protein [Sphingopyxis sp. MWB1]
MRYQMTGLDPAPFAPLFAMSDAELSARRAVRLSAEGRGYPCRITLDDVPAGEQLILTHHVSHDVETPFRSAYAIYVGRGALPATYVDEPPPAFTGRTMAFRGFDKKGMLAAARLVPGAESDTAIRALFDRADVTYIHAQYATNGCFAARIDRG